MLPLPLQLQKGPLSGRSWCAASTSPFPRDQVFCSVANCCCPGTRPTQTLSPRSSPLFRHRVQGGRVWNSLLIYFRRVLLGGWIMSLGTADPGSPRGIFWGFLRPVASQGFFRFYCWDGGTGMELGHTLPLAPVNFQAWLLFPSVFLLGLLIFPTTGDCPTSAGQAPRASAPDGRPYSSDDCQGHGAQRCAAQTHTVISSPQTTGCPCICQV